MAPLIPFTTSLNIYHYLEEFGLNLSSPTIGMEAVLDSAPSAVADAQDEINNENNEVESSSEEEMVVEVRFAPS